MNSANAIQKNTNKKIAPGKIPGAIPIISSS